MKRVLISPLVGTVHRDMNLLIDTYTLLPTLTTDGKTFPLMGSELN